MKLLFTVGLIGFVLLVALPSRATTKGATMGVFTDLRDDQTALAIADLGLGWVRIMYPWTWIEPSEGKANWLEFDRWVARAKAQHLKVLAVAQGSPAWANGGHGPYDRPSGLKTPPLPQFYHQFARYAAGLASHGADAVEIWNEPNGGFWLPTPDSKAWARLVVACYDAVKAVAPQIPVITGGLCPLPNGALNPNAPANFLHAALADVPEFAGKFDGIGLHPYVFGNDPKVRDPLTAPDQWNPIRQALAMRQDLARHGVGDRPFWFTEFGVPTGGSFGAVTPQESGTIYRHYYEAFDRLTAQGLKLGPTFFYTLHDSATYQKANTLEGWEGIYDLQGHPKTSVPIIKARATVAN